MLPRVLLVITITVLLHIYVGVRLIVPLPFAPTVHAALWVALLLMPMLQVITMTMRVRHIRQPRAFATFAVSTMAVFWLLFSLTAARYLVWGILTLVGKLPRHPDLWFLRSSYAVVAVTIVGLIYGVYEARRTPRIRPVKVPIDELPDSLSGFRIAQITDLHIGQAVGPGFVRGVVSKTNSIDADIIVLTGDIFDGAVGQCRDAAMELGALKAKYGVYYVTGNHEYYVGVDPWLEVVNELGIIVLHNDHRQLHYDGAVIVVAGVPDRAGAEYDKTHTADFAAAFAGSPAEAFKIALSHQPRTAKDSAKAGADLMLAGHTHGGQIFPFHYLVRLQQPIVEGLAKVGNMVLYTSRGTGYWGPPIRIFAPSEISHLELAHTSDVETDE